MGHCDNIILQVDIWALLNKLFQQLAFIVMLMIQIHESVCLEYQVDEYYPEELSNENIIQSNVIILHSPE